MSWNKDEILDLLIEAGAIAVGLKLELTHERKADHSLVTQADRAVETLITSRLERPGEKIYIIGEETVFERGEEYIAGAMKEKAYVVDPIDGTVPYAHGLPTWGISIGYMEGGELRHGAVYLPEMGTVVISDADAVLESRQAEHAGQAGQAARPAADWVWRELDAARPSSESYGLVAVTQRIAKRGRVLLHNPVMVLGAAVVPLVGLLQRQFVAYLGSVKLWDIAGCLPLLLKKGYNVTVRPQGTVREVGFAVDSDAYHLETASHKRWALRSDLLVCHPSDAEYFRSSFKTESAEIAHE